MAWWQHPEDQDTPPVTVERLTEWYEQQGYKYGVDATTNVSMWLVVSVALA